MKPRETIRFACEECSVVFDLWLAPPSEWADGGLATDTETEPA
jgi:hypothetical protein